MAAATVFISYSSRDESFALSLKNGLPEHEVWIDSEGVPGGTPFRPRIQTAIEASECLIVVLTRDWLESAECRKELTLAVDLHKRVIPVEPRRVHDVSLPPALNGLSPIGFWREGGRSVAMEKLRHDLVADHDLIRAHRDLLVDALRWQRGGNNDVRLRGGALRSAVRMVEQAAAGLKSPELVEVQREYVQACEAAEAAEVERLTTLNQRAVARHLAAEAQRSWAIDPLNIGLALRLVTESLRRAPSSTARSLANKLVRALPAPVQTLPESTGARIVTFSRDGAYLAFARDRRVQVWRAHMWTRQLDRTLGADVIALAFDGTFLTAVSGDGTARRIAIPLPERSTIFERLHRTGDSVGRPPDHDLDSAVTGIHSPSAALSADGRYVAWTRSRSVLVQFLGTTDLAPERFEFPLDPRIIALSPTGRYLLVCAQGPLRSQEYLTCLVDTEKGSRTTLDERFSMDPCFSPDGRFVAVRSYGGTTVWTVTDPPVKRMIRAELLAWLADSKKAICIRRQIQRADEPPIPRHELLEWDIEDDEQSHLLRVDHNPHPLCAFTVRRRNIVAFSTQRGVRVVDARLGTATAIVPHSRDTVSPLIAASPRGNLLATVSASDPLRVFDLAPEGPRSIGPFNAAIGVAAASRQGRWLARTLDHADGTDYGSFSESMDEVGPRAVTAGRVKALAVSEVGTFAAITTPRTIISAKGSAEFGAASLVIATTMGVKESPRAEAGQSVAISPDARWVAEVAADGAVALVDCNTRKEPITLPVADAVAVEFDDTGRYLLVFGDGRVDVFDGHAKVVSRQDVVCACFIRQEQPLLCVSDTAGRSVVLALPAGHERSRWSLSFAPSRLRSCGPAGDILAVNESTIIMIDPDTGGEKSRMNHLDPVREITPSPSGAYLLSETTTGRSTVWDVASSLQVFEIDEDHVRAVWISGDRLALVRGNRFDIEPASSDELIAEASSRGGELSRKEWQTYLPDERWPGESRPAGRRSVGSPDVQPDDDDTRAKRFV